MPVPSVNYGVSSRVVKPSKRFVQKKLTQMPEQYPASTKKADIKMEGSCGGLVSWSFNHTPVQTKKADIKAEGSCGGLVSWSFNHTPVQTRKAEGSCGGMVSWSTNASPAKIWLN